jgi:hypothetical protein
MHRDMLFELYAEKIRDGKLRKGEETRTQSRLKFVFYLCKQNPPRFVRKEQKGSEQIAADEDIVR